MGKKETIYDVVFKTYKLGNASKEKKEKIRKYIKRTYDKEYQKPWSELTTIDKNIFIYITIRKKMITDYVEPSYCSKVSKQIDSFLKQSFLDSRNDVLIHNSVIDMIYENYYFENDTDIEKMEKYNLLCTCIHNFNPNTPIPSYDEWINQPLRPYDYLSSFYAASDIRHTYYPTQSEIDHIVLQVLLKRINTVNSLEELKQTTIDINLIEECLTYLKNYNYDPFEPLLMNYNPNLEITKEEQESIIVENRRYFTYKKMLQDLAFLK